MKPKIVRTVAALRRENPRLARQQADIRRGPHHGGPARRPPDAGARRPRPGRPLHRHHLRQSQAVRRHEDLSRYPRDEEADVRQLARAGCNLIFAPPPPDEMYGDGFSTTVSLEGPAKAGLEDRFRPQFFDGVATVVAKLFIQSGADYAVFGEKDYQQLMVVTRMARDLDIPIEWSAYRRCARTTDSPCRRATATSRRPNASTQRPSTGADAGRRKDPRRNRPADGNALGNAGTDHPGLQGGLRHRAQRSDAGGARPAAANRCA